MDPFSVLTEQQAAAARPFIAAREADRKHLVIYLSGAHAYGFPSPDSDLDLKCVHVAPTADLVGLTVPDDPPDRIEIVDGVELDYGSNELAVVLRGEPPEVRVSDALRPTLVAIKKGEVAMPEVMALARELTPKLEAARQASPLPKHADLGRAERVLRLAREEAMRRWIAREAGPWGAGAPVPPEATYDD